MHSFNTRRDFLKAMSLGGTATLAGILSRLPAVSAEEANLDRPIARFDDSIEPLVRLIEESPRDKLLEQIGDRVRNGLSYREVLAALLLAGVRNVQPYPSVGFKFHAVLVVNSCHLASLAGPDTDRWLPLFWALDHFKSSQADEARTSGWRLPAVVEGKVPPPESARQEFTAAMDRWDLERADAATAGLLRSAPANEVFRLYSEYAARDFRSIGHKVIYLANAWRTLQVIGWEFAEPIFRSLTLALLNHGNEPNPADSDLAVDRTWRDSESVAKRIPEGWLGGRDDDAFYREVLAAGRGQSPVESVTAAAGSLERGAAPQSVWDGIFLGAGELLMRQPGIVALHGLTTANAMHYVWTHAPGDELRRRLLLQACAFNAYFRDAARSRGELRDVALEQIEPTPPQGTGDSAITDILTDVSGKPMQAAAKVQGYLANGGDPSALIDEARRLIFIKGRDAHDYKFSAAVLEDFQHVSPARRNAFLSLAVFHLKGIGDRDNGLVDRTRAALHA